MTNFQPQQPPRFGLTPVRLLQLAPVLLALVLGSAVAAAWLLPLSQRIGRLAQEQQTLQRQGDALAANRLRLQKSSEQLQRARQSQTRLLQLVAGTDQLDTLLAQLAAEAAATGVRLEIFEPQAAAASAETPPTRTRRGSGRKADQEKPAVDPLLVEGELVKRSQLVQAAGSFPALLAFLRRLESLSPLAVVSDLNLTQAAGAAAELGDEPTLLKFSLTAYSRAPKTGPAPSTSRRKEPAA